MAQGNNMSKMAGRAGSLMAFVGVILFFVGIFGPTRAPMLVGLALIGLALVAYFVEEFQQRRSA